MSKFIYQVHTRIFKEGDECHELSEFYSSRKKADEALRMLRLIYDRSTVDAHEEQAWREDQVSPSYFFNMRDEQTDVRFRVCRILKVEVN